MTSKEAVNRLSKYIGELGGGETLEEEDVILKDLEVLEILKRLIDIDYKVDFYTNRIDAIPKKILVNGTLTKQELEKIQEWLEK